VPGQAEQAGGDIGRGTENEPHKTNGLPHRGHRAAGAPAEPLWARQILTVKARAAPNAAPMTPSRQGR
jgi:hypothetical protein